MLDITLALIFNIGFAVVIMHDIKRYNKGKYNPIIFRREEESTNIELVCGIIGTICMISIKNVLIFSIVSLSFFLGSAVLISILNFKCYKKTREKKIIVQTVIANIITAAFVILIIIMSIIRY